MPCFWLNYCLMFYDQILFKFEMLPFFTIYIFRFFYRFKLHNIVSLSHLTKWAMLWNFVIFFFSSRTCINFIISYGNLYYLNCNERFWILIFELFDARKWFLSAGSIKASCYLSFRSTISWPCFTKIYKLQSCKWLNLT